MIKIRILNENIVTEEQEKMTLEQAIDFYNNNINSLVAMANGKQEKDPKLWKKFEKIALDSYQLIQNAMEEINKFANSNLYGRKENEKLQAVDLFVKNFTNYLKGEEFLKYPITSVMNIPDDYHSIDNQVVSNSFMKARVLNNKVTSLIIPKDMSDRIEEKDLENLYYIMERYTKWYENFKGKLGSWSQRNLPTVRKLLKLREGIVTEQDKITLSQIVGENSVISFDFDNTLVKSYPDFDEDGELIYINGGSNATMINLMKHLIDDPSKRVYLVTSRNEEMEQKTPEQSVKSQLDKLGVQPDGIFFTNSQPKVTKLKELGVEIHFDDDRMEHGDIQGTGIQSFYPDDFLEDTNQVSKVVAVTLDNKVLILKRADTGEFDIPGGHGKSGETPEFTAIRETLEETGLDLFGIKEIMSKEVDFKGRNEEITYFYAKLNNTSEMLMDDVDLDTNENTEFYFVEPQNIDEYMSNATNNLKNVANEIKSLTIDEQMEPFQRKMAAKHRKLKKKLIGLGGNTKKVAPYNQNPSYERSKSAPPGFGAMGEAKKEQKRRIKVKINQNLDEKRKKKKKKRKKRKKRAYYGGYFPYHDLYDGSGGDGGGDGGGGE